MTDWAEFASAGSFWQRQNRAPGLGEARQSPAFARRNRPRWML